MEIVDLAQCAVPAELAGPIRGVQQATHESPISVYRGDDAAPILRKYGKHTQTQISNANPAQRVAWGILGTPDRPRTSTHECRSDAVAYRGPVGRRLAGWQCGMDWRSGAIPQVMAAFRAQGYVPIHPYSAGDEYHHINLARAPRRPAYFYLPLKRGSRGLWVYILTGRLVNCGYLHARSSQYGAACQNAVRIFQRNHHLVVDGVAGVHTWLNLKAAERRVKRTGHKEA